MKVKDAHGGIQEYRSDNIVESCKRAGFSQEEAERIESRVFERAWNKISTKKLHSIVYSEMKKLNEVYALRYRLREAIANLNPNYHEFEKFVTKLLQEDGIDAEWSPRPLPQGECTTHEIDVVADDTKDRYIVECKHHYHHHRFSGLDIPMRQWARLQDLQKGKELGLKNAIDADRAWVVVNTRLSKQAKQYAECKGIKMTAWKYPEDKGLDAMIERNKAYPIMILRPPHHIRVTFSKNDILTVHDLLDMDDDAIEELDLTKDAIYSLKRTAEDMVE